VPDDKVPAKIKERVEDAKQAADKREDQLEQAAAKKVEPYLHEARQRLAKASHTDQG
jgi:vacuolar-type H+-ATPase subunit H